MIWHPELSNRVNQFTIEQQLVMICNELNRAQNNQEFPTEYKNCIERALELSDIFSSDIRWKPALRELRRGRNLIAQLYIKSEPEDTLWLQKVFLEMSSKAYKLMNPYE